MTCGMWGPVVTDPCVGTDGVIWKVSFLQTWHRRRKVIQVSRDQEILLVHFQSRIDTKQASILNCSTRSRVKPEKDLRLACPPQCHVFNHSWSEVESVTMSTDVGVNAAWTNSQSRQMPGVCPAGKGVLTRRFPYFPRSYSDRWPNEIWIKQNI